MDPSHVPTSEEDSQDALFLRLLMQGAELLQKGSAEDARTTLEQALQIRPGNQRGRNLLALSCFKLGLFERAEELYRTLIGEHPEDPALRINLGLVYLKMGRSDDAAGVFCSVLDRIPDHPKASNYLALAYAQRRDFALAKEWFERAGNTAMAEKMAANIPPPPATGDAAEEITGPQERAPETGTDGPPTAPSPVLSAAAGVPVGQPPTAVPPAPAAQAAVLPAAASESAMQALETKEQPFALATETASAKAPDWRAAPQLRSGEVLGSPFEPSLPEIARLAEPTGRHVAGGTFLITDQSVQANVRSELILRLDGLVAIFGALELKPLSKRFRGQVTDKPFGEANRRVMRALGNGRVWIAANGRTFHVLDVDEPAYLREDVLFAFEPSLSFENGRLPSKHSSDLHLVHLRERGKALIVARHAPRIMTVSRDEPCRLPSEVLLGWQGSLTPRIVVLADEPEGLPRTGIELSGEGRVLLDAPR
jgi:hypothetical protein